MRPRNFLLLCIFFLTQLSFAQDETQSQKLTWEPVAGAGAYEVTVQNAEGKTVFKKRINENTVDVELPTGKYRFKVQVFNRFAKPLTESPWSPLEIKRTFTPDILSYEPQYFYQDAQDTVLLIKGQGFLPETLFFLEKGNERIAGKILNLEKNWIVSVGFNIQGKSVGKYSLVIENPLDLTFQKSAGFEIKPNLAPKVKTMDPRSFELGLIYKDINLSGDNFEPGMTIEFRNSESILTPMLLTEPKAGIRTFYLDMSNAKLGDYDLYLKNPGGKEFTFKSVFSVTNQTKVADSPKKPEIKVETKPIAIEDMIPRFSPRFSGLPPKSNVASTPYKGVLELPKVGQLAIQEMSPKVMVEPSQQIPVVTAPGNGTFSFTTGASFLFLTSGLSSSFNPGALGGGIDLFMDMDNGFFKDVPLLNGLGLGAEGVFWSLDGTPNSVGTLSMKLLHTGVFLYVAPRWDLPIDFHLRSGIGVSSSWVDLTMTSSKIQSSSNDFYFLAGGDVEGVFKPLLVRVGADYRRIFFLNRVSDSISVSGAIGLRF